MKRFRLDQSILFENEDYLIINKPPYISCLDDRNSPISVLNELRKMLPDATLCHRLDKDTSGCLLASKHDDAYRNAAIQFEKRKVKKVYHAIVDGLLQMENKEVDLSIIKKNNGTSICSREGQKALTVFNTLQLFKHYSLLECLPHTGRFHQIRVHLQALKHPIAGDTLYGGSIPFLSAIKRKYKPAKREENPMIRRHALHAQQLTLTGLDGKVISVIAPYIDDFNTFYKLLLKHDVQ